MRKDEFGADRLATYGLRRDADGQIARGDAVLTEEQAREYMRTVDDAMLAVFGFAADRGDYFRRGGTRWTREQAVARARLMFDYAKKNAQAAPGQG